MGRFLRSLGDAGYELNPNPSIPAPANEIVEHRLHVTVHSNGVTLNEAKVELVVDSGLGTFTGERVNDFGYYRVIVPASVPKPYGGDLIVSADGYETRAERYLIQNVIDYDLNGGIDLEQNLDGYAEVGTVEVSGKEMYNFGMPWRMKAVSMFTLFLRYSKGENITPHLSWARAMGFNTLRVFGPLDWVEYPEYRRISDWSALENFFNLAYANGLRILWVPITTKANRDDHQELVNRSIEIADRVDNVFITICNEPLKDGKCDPVTLYGKSGGARKCLVDYGIYWADTWPNDWPRADFGTVHLTREYPKFARKSKDLLELRNHFGVPFIHDEPIGVAEIDISGRRTTDIDAIVGDAAIALLLGNGYCYHYDMGLHSILPNEGSVQSRCALALKGLFDYLPAVEDYNGSYIAPHLENFPMEWEEEDSLVNHAYGTLNGNVAYVVNVLPTNQWVPTGKNGWRVESNYMDLVYKLVR